MTHRRWSEVAIVALLATALIAAGVAVVAVVKATSENSPVQLVLETATATPSGPTAVPWADLPAEPSPLARPVSLSSPTPTPTDIPAPPCRASDLAAGSAGSDGGTNSGVTLNMVFADASPNPCRLDGLPDFVLVDGSGAPVPAPITSGQACVNGCRGGVLTPSRVKPVNDKLEMAPGDGRFGIHWPGYPDNQRVRLTSCDVKATAVVVRFREDGGEVSIPVQNVDGCLPAMFWAFQVWPAPPPPRPPPATFAVHLVAPTTVIAGEPLRYLVELTNMSPKEVMFVQGYCPNYVQKLGTPFDPKIRALNCSGVIAPGQMVAFAMEIDLPPGQVTGALDLDWSWHDTFAGSDHTIVDVVPAASSP